MSTPSVATTMLPVHHNPYGYPHQSTYAPTSSRTYPTNNTLPAPPRLTASYHSMPQHTQYQQPQPSPATLKQPSYAPSMASTQASGPGRENKKGPNWNEFYKNGPPKEIIVIDDDSPQPQASSSNTQRHDVYSTAGRKRKIDQGYEAEYADSPVYSTRHGQYDNSSSSASIHSAARTNSIQTVTAPTSLESYGSNPASNSYEDVRIGQKRKRGMPEKNTRSQAKRKQQEAVPDPFLDYVPPAKPARKAPEVIVPVIRDVSFILKGPPRKFNQLQSIHKHQKVDDEDGHYVIEEGLPLTDRCRCSAFLTCPSLADFCSRRHRQTARPGNLWKSCRGIRQAKEDQMCREDNTFCAEIPRCFSNRAESTFHSFHER